MQFYNSDTIMHTSKLLRVKLMNESIVAARKKKGLSQQELAEKVGCTQTNISHIELGRQNPTPQMAKKIADVLEINVLSILYPKESFPKSLGHSE